uniref:Uncharacterized protein n=1 Tax=Arundo donax TaxID=35708 RepID=A0A0A9A814_ARUDO
MIQPTRNSLRSIPVGNWFFFASNRSRVSHHAE